MQIAAGKLKSVLQHCVYEISTGKWAPGMKLPSVRKAEQMWGVNRLTVFSAYQELVKMDLIISEDRKGFFVSNNPASNKATASKEALDELYTEVKAFITSKTDFNFESVLKYFSSVSEKESLKTPPFAFIECSDFQSSCHAKEIYDKLGVAVRPVCIGPNLEKHLCDFNYSLWLTTGFHMKEVSELAKVNGQEVASVQIVVDPELFTNIPKEIKKVVILEIEKTMSSKILDDIKALASNLIIQELVVDHVDKALESLIANKEELLILLSPRVWGQVNKKFQRHPQVRPINFKIKDSSWNSISEAFKLPFPI